jgi:hypothetical protein
MNHHAGTPFWRHFAQLPPEVQKLASANFALLKRNPRHPSLQFKKIGKLWSARVGRKHRALAVRVADDYLWIWIGSHADYERFIG